MKKNVNDSKEQDDKRNKNEKEKENGKDGIKDIQNINNEKTLISSRIILEENSDDMDLLKVNDVDISKSLKDSIQVHKENLEIVMVEKINSLVVEESSVDEINTSDLNKKDSQLLVYEKLNNILKIETLPVESQISALNLYLKFWKVTEIKKNKKEKQLDKKKENEIREKKKYVVQQDTLKEIKSRNELKEKIRMEKELKYEKEKLDVQLNNMFSWALRISNFLIFVSWILTLQVNNPLFAGSLTNQIYQFWTKGITPSSQPSPYFGLHFFSQASNYIISGISKAFLSIVYMIILYYIPTNWKSLIITITVFSPFWKNMVRLILYYSLPVLAYFLASAYSKYIKKKSLILPFHMLITLLFLLLIVYSGYCSAVTDKLHSSPQISIFDDLLDVFGLG